MVVTSVFGKKFVYGAPLYGHTSQVLCLDFAGDYLASGGGDKSLRVYILEMNEYVTQKFLIS